MSAFPKLQVRRDTVAKTANFPNQESVTNQKVGATASIAPALEVTAELPSLSPDKQEAYEERAAIMEYDGGLTRQEAKRKAQAYQIAAQLAKARMEVQQFRQRLIAAGLLEGP